MTSLSLRSLTCPTGPFDACVKFQKESTELVVYSDLAKQIVTIAWPTFNRKKIVPSSIKNWLRARGLHWSCFCGLVSATSESTQIVQSIGDGKVYVFCSSYPPKCHFYLQLSELYTSATLESEYPHIPKLVSGLMPSTNNLLTAFLLRGADSIEVGPYFLGYCGEHAVDHPGSEQQSGSPIVVTRTGQKKTRSSLSAGIASSHTGLKFSNSTRSTATVAQPSACSGIKSASSKRLTTTVLRAPARQSTMNLGPSTPHAASVYMDMGPSLEEHPIAGSSTGVDTASNVSNILRVLEDGGGISKYQADGLLERCDKCREYFLAVFFKTHVLACTVM